MGESYLRFPAAPSRTSVHSAPEASAEPVQPVQRTTGPQTPGPRTVVAVVLVWRGRVGLFKRSRRVGHDAGLWHCITGFVEQQRCARTQALCELEEETGLAVSELTDFRSGPLLELNDAQGAPWRVHTFRAETERRRLQLNWEHESYRWVRPRSVSRFDGQVAWLHVVLGQVLP